MVILKFKQFESIQNDNYFDFPSFEDVEEFTTEVKPNMASGGIGFKV